LDEIESLTGIQSQVNDAIKVYLTGEDEWQDSYNNLLQCIHNQTDVLRVLLDTYSDRFVHLATHYDKSTKASTVVSENDEKLEECVEVTRTEMRELMKHLCGFTTLEMDYYDKLLSVWKQGSHSNLHPSTFNADYLAYRLRLRQIHRSDQVRLFGSSISSMISTIIHVITKLTSILNNRDNISEITKLWGENSAYQY
jgi:hypothetical protein